MLTDQRRLTILWMLRRAAVLVVLAPMVPLVVRHDTPFQLQWYIVGLGIVMATSARDGSWWSRELMYIALAALWTSSAVPAVGWWRPAFMALGFAVFTSDCALGWIASSRWKAPALTAIALVSALAEFAPRPMRLVALLALFAFWGVSLWRNSEPGRIVLSIPKS
jgi:hypothetical protein